MKLLRVIIVLVVVPGMLLNRPVESVAQTKQSGKQQKSKSDASQRADSGYRPSVEKPAYEQGKGPSVLIDEAHHNFHTRTGRYGPFAELLTADGYVVKSLKQEISAEALADCDVLVISNPIAKENKRRWELPTPSAFDEQEIAALVQWIKSGGSLILIADHMPFAGAAAPLAKKLGVTFDNGFVLNEKNRGQPLLFKADAGLNKKHTIVSGKGSAAAITSVATFTGSAFKIDRHWQPLLTFASEQISLAPKVAWKFDAETRRTQVKGWCQGATREWEKGRIAVFGEAAMFTAQQTGRRLIGLNSPAAKQNEPFVLNVLHWLSRLELK